MICIGNNKGSIYKFNNNNNENTTVQMYCTNMKSEIVRIYTEKEKEKMRTYVYMTVLAACKIHQGEDVVDAIWHCCSRHLSTISLRLYRRLDRRLTIFSRWRYK